MEFGSLEELVAYVENKMDDASEQLGKKMVEIAKEETRREQYKYSPDTYSRTGDLLNSIETTIATRNEVEIEWLPKGGWKSYKGSPYPYVAHSLENGLTYGKHGYRPATNFLEESQKKMETEVPKCYKQILSGLGIPIK